MLITAIEPDKMPMISGGKIQGQHKIEGIGDDFVPDLVEKNKIVRQFAVYKNKYLKKESITAKTKMHDMFHAF